MNRPKPFEGGAKRTRDKLNALRASVPERFHASGGTVKHLAGQVIIDAVPRRRGGGGGGATRIFLEFDNEAALLAYDEGLLTAPQLAYTHAEGAYWGWAVPLNESFEPEWQLLNLWDI